MLQDRVAIVTGAGQGIGRAIALELATAGAHVVASGRRLEPLETLAGEIRARGRRALAVSCDVRDAAQVDRVVDETMREFGRIDLLVNNAGYRTRARSTGSRDRSGTPWWGRTSPASSSAARPPGA
jgi:7-alpha-hydroxysteroid dehydrogenase